ncbi:group 1 truncated hemoglobin [Erythrobacter sp. NFXS35]|uniref:group I truncated hemoglobin n=1 Tax=Erythrobacter sp. NFXS35 TaxID=2818436 RepID=UPI0032DF1624
MTISATCLLAICHAFASNTGITPDDRTAPQIVYLLGAGGDYTGRDMRTAHEGMGVTKADLNALVENLQAAMREAGVPFAAQNRLLAKLAPMSRDVVER